jgi:DNA-directed RNA polymerase subunit RPC12/RpoP
LNKPSDVRCPHCDTFLDRPDMIETILEYKKMDGDKKLTKYTLYLCNICSREFTTVEPEG